MCVIIVKPKGTEIYKRTLRSCFMANPDGAGFMLAANKHLITMKGYFTFRSFYKSFRRFERIFPDSDFVLHMRIATSGLADYNNCHPFLVHNNLAFVHNGIFSGLGNKLHSDTFQFNEDILKKLPPNFLDISEIKDAITKYIEFGFDKVVFMDNLGKINIINEKAGTWKNGIWFSNLSHSYNYTGYGFYNKAKVTNNNRNTVSSPANGNNSDSDGRNSNSEDYYCQVCRSWFEAKYLVEDNGYSTCPMCGDILDVSDEYYDRFYKSRKVIYE